MRHFYLVALILLFTISGRSLAESGVDEIQFGDRASAKAHAMDTERSKEQKGALGYQALHLLPPAKEGWRGGTVTFTMKVDPEKANYFTAKFWGSDVTGEESRLMLFMDGKQIGQRHLGEIEQLDIMTTEPRYNERFSYKTLPLPEKMTRGKKTVQFTIEAQGPINGYRAKIEQYQLPMKKPSRGLYRAYTHTQPFFNPDASEPQGEYLTDFPVSERKPKKSFDEIKQIVNNKATQLLKGKDHIHVNDIHFLAIMYNEPWSKVYQKPELIEKVAKGLDKTYHTYLKERENDGIGLRWVGYGPAGEAAHILADELKPYLKTRAIDTKLNRSKAWGQMFKGSRDYHSQRRRAYTNQSLILDTNLYRCNSGLKAVAPQLAWPEHFALRLLHESMGLKPWSGSLDKRGRPSWSNGRNYYLLTQKGMTKELGYVGEYGESVFDLALHVYLATKPSYNAPGDSEIKQQMIKVSRARGVFRYPTADQYGNRTMRLEAVIGWRDWKFPGKITYDQRPGRDGGPIDVSVASGDPELMGYTVQMLEDNQLMPALAKRAEDRRGQAMLAMAISISAYEQLKQLEPSTHRLPTTYGQPNFVFADPEIGVIAIKNGDDILFSSLYWRARYAINNLARVHFLTPQIERDATVRIETQFQKSEHVYTVPNYVNEPFTTRHEKWYKGFGFELASAGEQQPIARVPKDQTDWKPGKENIFAGKGDFYLMEYGRYLIAMNCTSSRPIKFDVPKAFRGAKELVSGETIAENQSRMSVPPGETVVLYR